MSNAEQSPDTRAEFSDSDLSAALAEWLPGQRWFGVRETPPRPAVTHRSRLAQDVDGSDIEHVIVEVPAAGRAESFQVFLAFRQDVPLRLAHAVIGTAGGITVCDALHDAPFTALLLNSLAAGADLGAMRCRPEPTVTIDAGADGMVGQAEQSNTSVIYGTSSILKVFRRIQPGLNPDVEAHRALQVIGSDHIAQLLGEISEDVAGVPTTLAMLSEYFANCADGWAMAITSVRDLMAEGDLHADEVGGDFAAESHRLGAAVAAVHRDLAESFGTEHLGPADLAAVVGGMTDRARRVAAEIEQFAPHLEAATGVFRAALQGAAGLTVQRIHGDLHLGQALRTLRGWAVIDFEGEPAHPLAYRRAKHSVLKDIAGMLRSFDYAAHQPLITAPDDTQLAYRAGEWADRNRKAFCAGYADGANSDPRQASALLRAYELDKAVYELAYEHRHRPSWLPIPLRAIEMLASQGGSA